MTLWPISMLSRIFDSDSAAVPPIQAGGRKPEEQQAAARDLQAALDADELVDVVDVALAEVRDDARADGVELLAEGFELLGVRSGAVLDMAGSLRLVCLEVERDVADRH